MFFGMATIRFFPEPDKLTPANSAAWEVDQIQRLKFTVTCVLRCDRFWFATRCGIRLYRSPPLLRYAKKMDVPELQQRFESAAKFFRREIITEEEFAQKVMDLAIYHFDELADVKPSFSRDELRKIASFVSTHSDEDSLKMAACGFIVDFNEPGIVEQRMEEIRPKFEKVVEYFTIACRMKLSDSLHTSLRSRTLCLKRRRHIKASLSTPAPPRVHSAMIIQPLNHSRSLVPGQV